MYNINISELIKNIENKQKEIFQILLDDLEEDGIDYLKEYQPEIQSFLNDLESYLMKAQKNGIEITARDIAVYIIMNNCISEDFSKETASVNRAMLEDIILDCFKHSKLIQDNTDVKEIDLEDGETIFLKTSLSYTIDEIRKLLIANILRDEDSPEWKILNSYKKTHSEEAFSMSINNFKKDYINGCNLYYKLIGKPYNIDYTHKEIIKYYHIKRSEFLF